MTATPDIVVPEGLSDNGQVTFIREAMTGLGYDPDTAYLVNYEPTNGEDCGTGLMSVEMKIQYDEVVPCERNKSTTEDLPPQS